MDFSTIDYKSTNFNQMDPMDQCNYAYWILYSGNVDLIKNAILYFPDDMLIDFLMLLFLNYDLMKPPSLKDKNGDEDEECDPFDHYNFLCSCFEPDPPPKHPIFADKFPDVLLTILTVIDPKYYFHILDEIKPYPDVEKLVYNKILQSDELMLYYAKRMIYRNIIIEKVNDDSLISFMKHKIVSILKLDPKLLTQNDYDNFLDILCSKENKIW